METKKLYRSKTNRHVGGVCGGLAEYFNIDPLVVRLGMVVLALLSGPIGIIIYIIMWLVVPEEQ